MAFVGMCRHQANTEKAQNATAVLEHATSIASPRFASPMYPAPSQNMRVAAFPSATELRWCERAFFVFDETFCVSHRRSLCSRPDTHSHQCGSSSGIGLGIGNKLPMLRKRRRFLPLSLDLRSHSAAALHGQVKQARIRLRRQNGRREAGIRIAIV
jgi:hypothetical protein